MVVSAVREGMYQDRSAGAENDLAVHERKGQTQLSELEDSRALSYEGKRRENAASAFN